MLLHAETGVPAIRLAVQIALVALSSYLCGFYFTSLFHSAAYLSTLPFSASGMAAAVCATVLLCYALRCGQASRSDQGQALVSPRRLFTVTTPSGALYG